MRIYRAFEGTHLDLDNVVMVGPVDGYHFVVWFQAMDRPIQFTAPIEPIETQAEKTRANKAVLDGHSALIAAWLGE